MCGNYVNSFQGWNKVNMDVKAEVQERFLCCGFQDNLISVNKTIDYPSCVTVNVSNMNKTLQYL